MPGSPPISSAEPTTRPPPQHAVELGDAAPVARRLRRRSGQAGELERAGPCRRAPARRRPDRARVPLPRRWCSTRRSDSQRPLHLRRDRAARLADEALDRAGHQCSSCLDRHQPSPCSQQSRPVVQDRGAGCAPPACPRLIVQRPAERRLVLLAARAGARVEADPSGRAGRQLAAVAIEPQHEAAALLGRHRQQQAAAVGQRVEPPGSGRGGAGEGQDHVPLALDPDGWRRRMRTCTVGHASRLRRAARPEPSSISMPVDTAARPREFGQDRRVVARAGADLQHALAVGARRSGRNGGPTETARRY